MIFIREMIRYLLKFKPDNKFHRMILDVQAIGETPPTEIHLLPYGLVKSKKGDFINDDQAIDELITNFNAEANDVVIDYEHQTLKDVEAPAAGWIKQLINKGEEGLWAVVEWTNRASDYISNKEYRYFSPVIFARKSDMRAVLLHSGALTNTPAIDGMVPLVNKDSTSEEVNKNMDELIQQLQWMLNLPITATTEEIIAELQKLIQRLQGTEQVANKQVLTLLVERLSSDPAAKVEIVANKEVLQMLDLDDTATLDQAKGKIIALKNPSGYVSAAEFNALKDTLALRNRDELVSLALTSGKVTPAQKGWAEEYAMKDPAGFKAFLDTAAVVVPLKGGIPPAPAGGSGGSVDDVQLQVNKQLGIGDDDFKQYGGAE